MHFKGDVTIRGVFCAQFFVSQKLRAAYKFCKAGGSSQFWWFRNSRVREDAESNWSDGVRRHWCRSPVESIHSGVSGSRRTPKFEEEEITKFEESVGFLCLKPQIKLKKKGKD